MLFPIDSGESLPYIPPSLRGRRSRVSWPNAPIIYGFSGTPPPVTAAADCRVRRL